MLFGPSCAMADHIGYLLSSNNQNCRNSLQIRGIPTADYRLLNTVYAQSSSLASPMMVAVKMTMMLDAEYGAIAGAKGTLPAQQRPKWMEI